MVWAAFLRAGQRMAADKMHAGGEPAVKRGDDLPLRASRIRKDRSLVAMRGRFQDLARDKLHRSAEYDQFRIGDGRRQLQKALVNGIELSGAVQGALPVSDAEHALGDAPALGRESNGRTDETDADDGERLH